MMNTAQGVVTYRTSGFTFWREGECSSVLMREHTIGVGAWKFRCGKKWGAYER